ncbi:hypothetical protein KEM55_008653 [Ascosphaera atra]|nr:hypothetical protein KEM55_008653 [Ascosphaera atra]
MSYGARGNRRRVQSEERQDPNVIPTTSFLGFLESFPWRPRGRGVKYRPSAADLQENLSGLHRVEEEESLLNQSDDNEEDSNPGHGQTQDSSQRQRSSTQLSRETTNSLSSRGDLIPSDEEQEDAIPLDDSFEVALQRRGTGFTMNSSDGPSSRRSVSGTSLATQGSGSGKDQRQSRRSTKSTTISRPSAAASDSQLPSTNELSYDDLRREEEEAARHEELIIQKKRQAAETLARSRGLSQPEVQTTAGASNRDSTSKVWLFLTIFLPSDHN